MNNKTAFVLDSALCMIWNAGLILGAFYAINTCDWSVWTLLLVIIFSMTPSKDLLK